MTQQPADALAMSLDDIIVKQKSAKRQGKKPERKPQQQQKVKASSLATTADKLVVSNLAQSVSQNDVKELFSRIGPVRSAQLNFNQEGKSKGVATVVFVKAGDAHKAFQEYNNRPLDEKPMKIELMINPESSRLKQLDSRLGGIKKGGDRERGKGRGGKKNTRERVPKKDVSAMDLDADMDAYMKQDGEASESLAAALG